MGSANGIGEWGQPWGQPGVDDFLGIALDRAVLTALKYVALKK
jgi:hypothetical protein